MPDVGTKSTGSPTYVLRRQHTTIVAAIAAAALLAFALLPALAQGSSSGSVPEQLVQARQAKDPRYSQTEKPPLHVKHWLAITGMQLSATAGALIFAQGGNQIRAAAAMSAAGCTIWDTLLCGGETQALICDWHTKKVIRLDALGVAPTVATAYFYRSKGH